MLHINDLTYRMEGRPLFDQATLHIPQGSKFGLVGRNGTGKSTLFRLIKGELSADDGSVSLRKSARLGCVDQEVPSGPQSLLDTVLDADLERAALMKAAETEQDGEEIARIHMRLADIDAYTAEARASSILNGLGFSASEQLLPCSDFSGGWRMRVALAAMLFAQPDMLLLDEPTNYLDVEGAVWLENHIRSYLGTIFVISHDRDFLNQAVTHIAHLRHGKLTSFTGNYDEFEKRLAEQNSQMMALKGKQEAERRHLQSFVDRFKAKASKAKQAQSRVKKLEKMTPIATIISDPIPPIDLPSPEKQLSPPILRYEDVALGYEPTRSVLKNLDLRFDPDDRIGLLGKNGEGKSTFAKSVMQILEAQNGYIRRNKKLEIGYFAQHEIDALNPKESAYDHIVDLMPEATEAQRRARLGRFGLTFAQAETPAGDLSGGEKARLLFSLVGFHKPHLLVLDEPANHLDMDSRAELISALNDYEGAILIISHDRNLLESVVDRLWIVRDRTISTYEGSLEEYRKEQLETSKPKISKNKNPDLSKAEQRKAAAAARASIAPLKKTVTDIEKRMAILKQKMAQIDHDLTVNDLFTTEPESAVALSQTRAQHEGDLEDLEVSWFEALDVYETAKAAL